MLVSEAVGATLAELGADTVFGVVGSGNFQVTNALVAAGRAVRRGPARGRRGEHGRRLRADVRPAHGAHGAPGPRADQRDDRHHRGRQEPHAAAGAGRRGDRGRAVQLPHRRRRIAAAVGAVHRSGPPRHGPRSRTPPRAYGTAGAAGPWCLRPGAAGRAGRAPCDCRPPPPSRPVDPIAAPAWRRWRAGRWRWPGRAAPGVHRRAGRQGGGGRPDLERLADACGALLATSAAAKGLFRGSPWDLDVCGGFATPLAAELIGARRPDRRLGLHAQHVDHAARPADRPGGDRHPGRP